MADLKLKRLSIGKGSYIHFDITVIDELAGQLVFASLVDNDKELKNVQFEINKRNQVYIESNRKYLVTNGKYDIEKRKQGNSDFCHLVLNKRDSIDELADNNEVLTAYIYTKNSEELNTKIYDKLYDNTSIPLIEEWIPYIKEELIKSDHLRQLNVISIYETEPFYCHKLIISKVQLLEIIQKGIREHNISINSTYENSELMGFIDGLDSYLNVFGDTLAQRIQESFTPKFNPAIDTYEEYVNHYDDSCFYNGIELYQAQKATIQAAVNNLKENNVTFLIGEMGCGMCI